MAEKANILNLNGTLETERAEPIGKTTFFQGASVESMHNTLLRAAKKNDVKSMAIIWPINGGLMYRLTKGSPRYAFKQFQADGDAGRDDRDFGRYDGDNAEERENQRARR